MFVTAVIGETDRAFVFRMVNLTASFPRDLRHVHMCVNQQQCILVGGGRTGVVLITLGWEWGKVREAPQGCVDLSRLLPTPTQSSLDLTAALPWLPKDAAPPMLCWWWCE